MTKWFCGLIAAVTIAFASGPVVAQINGSYYATPSWDQQLPAAQRLIVLANWNSEAVLDRETGLVWQRAPDTVTLPWNEIFKFCRQSITGGRLGWRAPTGEELATLVDPTASNPPLPVGHPFQGITAGDIFWTASTFEPNLGGAYYVQFSTAHLAVNADLKGAFYRTWCVRGGSSPQNPQ
jgi:hypothetical protein